MKSLVIVLVLLLVAFSFRPAGAMMATGSWGRPGLRGNVPVPFVSGGPDDYGYTWIDNQDPGGPTFHWVDITGVGTQVTGLGDDNSVGPFPIGFEFPYYWYTVDHFYIGSNGWISFSSGQNYAHPFSELPDPNPPNDLLACLAGDIDFTKGGTCYYYTTPGLDSLIVSYIDVPEFYNVPPSSHTFQIILSRADSAITFQYGEQNGDFSSGGSNAFSMGMENSTGTIGLSYFYNPRTSPPPDPPPFADSTVIRFVPPESTTLVVHDIGVINGVTEGGKGVFTLADSAMSIWSDVMNFGNQTEHHYGAAAVIKDEADSTVYSDSITVLNGTFLPSEIEHFQFVDPFLPPTEGLFTATLGGHLPPGVDLVPDNDDMEVEIHSLTYPGDLLYDDGGDDDALYWSGDSSGFGNEFDPPEYPTYIENAQVSFDVQAPGNVVVAIMGDDGPGGGPGSVLASRTIYVSSPGWRVIDFSGDAIAINEGKFFVGAIALVQATVGFTVDNNAPYSRRSWEYTGGWAPSRWMNQNDMMIRAGVSDTLITNVVDEGPDVVLPTAFSLSQNYPNPFNPRTTIEFTVPGESGLKRQVSLEVYDMRGRRVRTLVDGELDPGSHRVNWDGRDNRGMAVSSGVYLYTLKTKEGVRTRKMALLK